MQHIQHERLIVWVGFSKQSLQCEWGLDYELDFILEHFHRFFLPLPLCMCSGTSIGYAIVVAAYKELLLHNCVRINFRISMIPSARSNTYVQQVLAKIWLNNLNLPAMNSVN